MEGYWMVNWLQLDPEFMMRGPSSSAELAEVYVREHWGGCCMESSRRITRLHTYPGLARLSSAGIYLIPAVPFPQTVRPIEVNSGTWNSGYGVV